MHRHPPPHAANIHLLHARLLFHAKEFPKEFVPLGTHNPSYPTLASPLAPLRTIHASLAPCACVTERRFRKYTASPVYAIGHREMGGTRDPRVGTRTSTSDSDYHLRNFFWLLSTNTVRGRQDRGEKKQRNFPLGQLHVVVCAGVHGETTHAVGVCAGLHGETTAGTRL